MLNNQMKEQKHRDMSDCPCLILTTLNLIGMLFPLLREYIPYPRAPVTGQTTPMMASYSIAFGSIHCGERSRRQSPSQPRGSNFLSVTGEASDLCQNTPKVSALIAFKCQVSDSSSVLRQVCPPRR